MTDTAATPVRVCADTELADGQAVTVPAGATGWSDTIAVFRENGALFALDDTCPHEQASLAEGWLEDGEIECPLHQSRFSLRTGEATCLPATSPARTHRVEVRDGAIWLTAGTPPQAG
ncbi:bifunctional 3-phenylpropionate/cinnamic acid dioxygenase ferredoxin subunit [Kitasatospora sp. NPDC051853]|uniref:bifunctional 3-phenylpropionate/cinnamic acid dioxygenase ferredoxin subunit n=1 Tax=Kitasatospora sp. NPDC051853 TaxID=3364058 RepID=UPI0037B0B1C2